MYYYDHANRAKRIKSQDTQSGSESNNMCLNREHNKSIYDILYYQLAIAYKPAHTENEIDTKHTLHYRTLSYINTSIYIHSHALLGVKRLTPHISQSQKGESHVWVHRNQFASVPWGHQWTYTVGLPSTRKEKVCPASLPASALVSVASATWATPPCPSAADSPQAVPWTSWRSHKLHVWSR